MPLLVSTNILPEYDENLKRVSASKLPLQVFPGG
jgi:hypothetical protein